MAPANYIRVRYTGTSVVVETTTNLGISFTTQGTFAASFVSGDTLTHRLTQAAQHTCGRRLR